MSERSDYYKKMETLAHEQRALFNISGARISRTEFRKIYKHYGIGIDQWPMAGMGGKAFKKLRGVYFPDLSGIPAVLIARLPDEPYIFTLAHELKHHLMDRDSVGAFCLTQVQDELKEIGAEVFAAEFIYPTSMFHEDLDKMDVVKGSCTARDLVVLKHQTATSLSYAALVKRAEFTGYAAKKSLPRTGWKKLEERIYGEPIYKRLQRMRKTSN
ncbi:ImmA/IrrE family metallo-endopeptidase [Candidatus Saccharibacteria bacterium]|nr:ImmA/IrrE family metallo-endopeptidase [Candidatus Saccharibacteria bacterium]